MHVLDILRQKLCPATRVIRRPDRPPAAVRAALALLSAALFCLPAPSTAAEPTLPDLAAIEPGGVLRLDDGRVLRLAFLRMPDTMTDMPADARFDGASVERWRERSEAAIATAFRDGGLRAEPVTAAPDRHGAQPALLRDRDGGTLQAMLLAEGLARLDLAALTDPRADGLPAAERNAREAGKGLWSAFPYRVRDDAEVGAWLGTFQIVRARIHRAARVGDNVFVNFGPDHRTDFTVLFKDAAARRFLRLTEPLGRLAGCEVLVRGWIEYWNGPLVAATEPAQLEFPEPCA